MANTTDNVGTNGNKAATATEEVVSPRSKFQAAGFAVGGAALAKKDKLDNKLQTLTVAAQDKEEKAKTTAAARTSSTTASSKVTSKLKFQAAAFAVQSSNANKAIAAAAKATTTAAAARTETTNATATTARTSTPPEIFYDVDNPLLSVSAAFTNAKTGENAISPKSKFQAAAFAVKTKTSNNNGKNKASAAAITEFTNAAITEDGEVETAKEDDNDNNDPDPEPAIDNWAKLAYAAKITALAAKNARVKQQEKLFNRCVIQATTWDIWSPPPINSVTGKVIPRLFNKHKHRRRVSLEIHRVTPILANDSDGSNGENDKKETTTTGGEPKKKSYSYHESVLRILVPASKELSRQYKIDAMKKIHSKAGSTSSSDSLREINEAIYDHNDENDADDDDGSVSSSSNDESSRYYELADHGGKEYEGWKPKYSIPMYGIYIRGHKKKTVNILISFNDFKQEREIIFDTVQDTKLFLKEIEKQKRLENTRQDERLQSALGDDISLPKFETITFLFEIVSAYDIPIGDYTTSDPYVTAFLGHQEIHRTKHLSKTLNPIWTLKTGSLFLLTVESKRFFIEDGMKFVLKDYDQIGHHDVLGVVNVEPKILYNSTGQRLSYKLQPPPNSKLKEVPGILIIRCRRASQYDQKFMTDYEKKGEGMKGVSRYVAPVSNTNVFKTITTKVKRRDKDNILHYKIRPGPDPKRPPEETEWLTNPVIQKNVLEPSHEWVDMGEGELGKVYVEILGCDGLPNMDSGGFYGNKTDTFVACVYEDVYGRTDVIDDCLSPRWLPWSNRAFIFSMGHPSSLLNIGVFDYDAGSDRLSDHDLIGRISVDLTNFRSATEYVLSYNICPSARIAGRKSEGKVMIRLRMDIFNERKLVLASLSPPKATYVNTTSRKDFRVIRQTCFGAIDEHRYSIQTLKSYIDELRELQYALFYMDDALMTLLLWRGHFEMKLPFRTKKIKLPIHSFNAFVISTFLVEHPQLFPSFFFGSVAWLLFAIMGWRRNVENVWYHCHSYFAIFKMLSLGDDFAEPHKIEPFENFDAATKEMVDWVKRVEDSEARAQRNYEKAEESELERQKELADIGEADTDLGTKVGSGGLGLDPVRAALFPIQLMLGLAVKVVRFTKNVITWQEAYFSFWISTGSLVLAILCLFVPWAWCIKWFSRIFAWTVFGPWMKLLDIYYFSLIKPESDVERQRREQAEKLKDKLATTEYVLEQRIVRENAAKRRAMKKYMFGRYALRIPILKQDRYADMPLAESFATPYKEKDFSLAELAMQEAGYNKKRIPGQTLEGDMIPYVRGDDFTLAPTGRAAAHPEKLSKNAPGASALGTSFSSIVGAVAVAILVTYFGTPLLATLLSEGSKWIESS